MPHRVYLVEDDADVREALALLLRTSGMDVEVFTDAPTFLGRIGALPPGCIVADIRMPAISGLQLQEKLVAQGCGWPIIIITGHGDINACRRAFKAGAVEFLTKPVDEHDLLQAIEAAMAEHGQRSLREAEAAEAAGLIAQLTPREREVLDMVARGWATKEIAVALAVSPRTVEAHRAHLAAKLGTTSVAEMAQLVMLAAARTNP
jgi:FixJ family two-component response regulator